MNRVKKVSIGILVVFIVIQVIQPARNYNGYVLATDITKTIPMPQNIMGLLQRSCYDCHSNNTHYLWYDNIQPGRWFIEHHIKQGKANLNFNEFGSYSKRKQQNKLRGISNSIKEESMPVPSYSVMHKNSRLTKEEKILIMDWMSRTADSLK